MSGIVFGSVLPWLLVAAGGWVVLKLVGQSGRILLRLEAIEGRVGRLVPTAATAPPEPAGLPVGSAAPGFKLPRLEGGQQSLSDYKGKPVLLVFFNPQCGYCLRMLADLAALRYEGAGGRPVPLVITNGDPGENRRIFREHKVGCPVLIQDQMVVAAKYRVQGTPIGYLIDGRGRIASPLVVGAEALLALAGGKGSGEQHKGKGNRALSTSKLVRNGLASGTPAPPFRLPRVGGGEVTLADYLGGTILLVFSDPQCGPCDQIAPELESRHRQGAGVSILMVSRRDMDWNERKVAEKGLTFPVGVQKNWDTSKDYGMFATPIGYLIDERGMVAADVAVGVDPILALFDEATAATTNGSRVAPAGYR